MSIESIKELLGAGDVAGAETAAQELLAAELDNMQAMMLYGTCRQLQGDEATFRRIHDELALRMSSISDGNVLTMWQTYCNEYVKVQRPRLVQSFDYAQAGACLMEYVLAGGLIVIAVGVAIYCFGRPTYSLYAAPGQMEAVTGRAEDVE